MPEDNRDTPRDNNLNELFAFVRDMHKQMTELASAFTSHMSAAVESFRNEVVKSGLQMLALANPSFVGNAKLIEGETK